MTLPVRDFEAEGFRSLKSIAYPMSGLDVFVGANGVGKTNLYRALELLQAAAANRLAGDLAREGGLQSALWAGPRRRNQQPELRLAVGLADPAPRLERTVLEFLDQLLGKPAARWVTIKGLQARDLAAGRQDQGHHEGRRGAEGPAGGGAHQLVGRESLQPCQQRFILPPGKRTGRGLQASLARGRSGTCSPF